MTSKTWPIMDGKTFLKTMQHINVDESRLPDRRASLLRASGWSYSSSNPACIWLWSKDFPASAIQGTEPQSFNGVSTEVAVTIECRFRALYLPKDHPERWPEELDGD